MRITLKVQYLDDGDKVDSIHVVSDMLTAYASNTRADSLTLSISRYMPRVYGGPYHPDTAYDNPGSGYRYTGKKFNADQ